MFYVPSGIQTCKLRNKNLQMRIAYLSDYELWKYCKRIIKNFSGNTWIIQEGFINDNIIFCRQIYQF